jgi:hypothetical protein
MKIRDFAAWMMLTAAAGTALNGCITTNTTQWETARTETRRGAVREVTESLGSRIARERTFEISDAYFDEEKQAYKTRITESLKEFSYDGKLKRNLRILEDIAVEQRKTEDGATVPLILALLGFGGGSVAGTFISPKNRELNIILTALAGAGVFGLVGLLFPPVTIGAETRAIKTGTREEYEGTGREEETLAEEKWLYRDKASESIRFGRKGDSNTYRIRDGTLAYITEPNKAITKEKLEEKLYDIPLLQEILPDTRERLRQEFVNAIEEDTDELEIETREPQLVGWEKVKNTSKVLRLVNYKLTNEAIYGILGKFIDKEVNSQIKTLNISVRDYLSHAPVENFSFEVMTDAPTKSKIAERYVTGSLIDFATDRIPDYFAGKKTLKNCTDTVSLKVFPSSRISFEVTNPKYNFAEGNIDVRGDMKEVVDMVEKGSKVRIQAEEDAGKAE